MKIILILSLFVLAVSCDENIGPNESCQEYLENLLEDNEISVETYQKCLGFDREAINEAYIDGFLTYNQYNRLRDCSEEPEF